MEHSSINTVRKKIFDRPWYDSGQIMFFVACLYPIALIYSKFSLTLCMLLWFIGSLIDIKKGEDGFRMRLSPIIRKIKLSFFNSPFFWITLFFWLVLISGLQSAEPSYWLERLRIKMPFLFLPIAFFLFPKLSPTKLRIIYYTFLLVLFISCLHVGIGYLLNYREITLALGQGHPIPTPVSHIRFSLMVAFGVLLSFTLSKQEPLLYNKGMEKWVLWVISFFLFIFLHILSVRSGLLVLYLSIFVGILYDAYRRAKVIRATILLFLLAMMPVIAYQFVPAFRNRMNYARYDLEMYLKGEGAGYSDSGRLLSLQTGWEIFMENKWLGTGAGNLKRVVEEKYKQISPSFGQATMPHNQLLSVLAGSGIIGLIVFLMAFSIPIFYEGGYRNTLFSLFNFIVFISFAVENTLETAVGVGFYSFFLLLFIKEKQQEEETINRIE